MITIYFDIPSDYTDEDIQTVHEEFVNFGGIIKTYNPLAVIVEDPQDVEDMIGLGLDYGLSVRDTVYQRDTIDVPGVLTNFG
jgi:hypothetical protein